MVIGPDYYKEGLYIAQSQLDLYFSENLKERVKTEEYFSSRPIIFIDFHYCDN